MRSLSQSGSAGPSGQAVPRCRGRVRQRRGEVLLSDEYHPRVTHNLRLAINAPEYVDQRWVDTSGNGFFGYDARMTT